MLEAIPCEILAQPAPACKTISKRKRKLRGSSVSWVWPMCVRTYPASILELVGDVEPRLRELVVELEPVCHLS